MNNVKQAKIGTRGSPLALAQAEMTKAAMIATLPSLAEPGALSIEVIKTQGDHILDRPLAEVGGKGLFTKEIEERLQSGDIDLAVHSMKDVATSPPDDLVFAAMLPRADVRDVLVSRNAARIDELPQGAHVGTASLRRAAQLKWLRPDIQISNLRGSVQTRLQRIEDGNFAATLLAKAGLDRLGIDAPWHNAIPPETMLPAVAQGAIGIQCRRDDRNMRELLQQLDDAATHHCVETERAFLAVLDGSCRTPIAGQAVQLGDGRIAFEGLVARPDGSELHRDVLTASADSVMEGARELGARFKALIGPDFFAV